MLLVNEASNAVRLFFLALSYQMEDVGSLLKKILSLNLTTHYHNGKVVVSCLLSESCHFRE